MFIVSEADAAAIRTAYEQAGELSAAVELRRRFPGITDHAEALSLTEFSGVWAYTPNCPRSSGYIHVVDADLKSYFDTIPKDRLLALVAGKVASWARRTDASARCFRDLRSPPRDGTAIEIKHGPAQGQAWVRVGDPLRQALHRVTGWRPVAR
jgi:hypothetical protein